MSILTRKMAVTNKSTLGDYMKVFFPFNEGSGDIATDILTGLEVTDLGNGGTWDVAHSMLISKFDVHANIVPDIEIGNRCFMSVHQFKVNTDARFGSFFLGESHVDDVSYSILISGTHYEISHPDYPEFANNVDMSLYANVGDDVLTAGALDSETGQIRYWYSVNGGSVVELGNVFVPELVNQNVSLGPEPGIAFNVNVFPQDSYAACFAVFQNGIPDDITDALLYFSQHWRKGQKFGYPGWVNLA